MAENSNYQTAIFFEIIICIIYSIIRGDGHTFSPVV